MASFKGELRWLGPFTFPTFSKVRVMMMPFRLDDQDSIPVQIGHWAESLFGLLQWAIPAQSRKGVGYLTIDEAWLEAGETHRRPGLHVDGVGEDGKAGGWGGGGGGYAASGMIVAASCAGAHVYPHEVQGWPQPNGDCAHLATQCGSKGRVVMRPNVAYWMSGMTMHEAVPVAERGPRQFLRVSMPSDAPWHEGYTENPLGIKPTGPIAPARTAFMNYRQGSDL